MNKKNKILNIIFIIINGIIIYFISSNRWVNRMPGPGGDYSSVEDFYALFLGHGLPTVITALITAIISFLVNKVIIKQDLKMKDYIILFFIILIINILVYRVRISIVV